MPRRPHKKSRSGCAECKKRHIKCDEHHPSCVNCKTAGLKCSFSSDESPGSSTISSSTLVDSGTSSTSTPVFTPKEITQNAVTPVFRPLESGDPTLNMQHLEFLHQYCTDTYRTFAREASHQEVFRVGVVRMGFSFPFLMHELLAIAALHLAYCRPEMSKLYTTKSIELQTQALTSFTTQQITIDASNCAPVLIFTSLLSFNILSDPSRTEGLNSNQYLDHVIESIMLLRNIRRLIIWDWQQHIKETELKPLFDVEKPVQPYDIPQPCTDLAMLAHNSDLSREASEAYQQAIERLQWAFCVSRVPYQTHATLRWLLAWPIQTHADYLDLLSQRRPEALVILAYFGVLMVFYRDCWAVGNTGLLLIRAIAAQLGPRWQIWMEWPISFLPETE